MWSFGRIGKKRVTDHDFPPQFMWAENNNDGLPLIKFSSLSHDLKYSSNVPCDSLVQKRNNYWNYRRSYNHQRNFN